MCPLALPVTAENGSPVFGLAQAYMDSRAAVHSVIAALCEASPNARDYEAHGPRGMRLAEEGHSACWRALNALGTELLWLADPDLREGESTEIEDLLSEIPLRPQVFPRSPATGYGAIRTAAMAVFRATEVATEKLTLTTPHRGDFDTMKNHEIASIQHDERMTLLRRVGGYFHQIAQACPS